ncbi:hypothetical protein MON38_17835 [Hymenobacter sp. DH14]|uniref:Glycosyltransferase RgtA/B/C/D-like domain-containing protein n=1 Tax=Hymenobacter cyanobacteriorum TaxID=2926463 RepID=A0A9X1VJF0_9BACT|nr:hypothetical protein [Hymenobacter cyanobacteriorum]MCI1189288.1 hypothetical protein [Hymenobacter cyanobacteriorum]
MQEFTIRPPGYPAMLVALGGVAGPWLVLLVQNGLSVLALGVVLGWWGRRAHPLPQQWLAAVALALTFPAQLIYANAVMSEGMLQILLLGLVAALLAFYRTGKWRYWLGAAAAVALALLLKPVCGLLAGAFALAGLVAGWRTRQAWAVIIGLLPLLVAGAYMAWNQQRTGYFHFSSITEINLLHYNAAGVVRQVDGAAAEEAWVAKVLRAANAQQSFAARQQLIQTEAGAVLRAHPWVYARQHLLGMMTFFLDPGRFDISEFLGLAPLAGGGLLAQVRAGGLWRAIGQLPWGLLAGLLLILLANITRLLLAVRGFRELGQGTGPERAGRWLAVGLLAYLALMTGPLGAARFLMPAWPLLLALALAGLRAPTRPVSAAATA